MESEDTTGAYQGYSPISGVFLEEEPIDLSIKGVNYENCQAGVSYNEEPIDLTTVKKNDEHCPKCAALSENDEPRDCRTCRYKKIERVKRALTFSDDEYPKKIRKMDFGATKRSCDLEQTEDAASYHDKDDETTSIVSVEEDEGDKSEADCTGDEREKNVANIVKPFVPSPSAKARMGFTDEPDHTFMYNNSEGPVIEYVNSWSSTGTALTLNSDGSPINCTLENCYPEDIEKYNTEKGRINIDLNGNSKHLYGIDEEAEENDPIFSNPYITLNLRQNKLLYKGRVLEGIDVTVHDPHKNDDTSDSSMDAVQLAKDYRAKRMVRDYFNSIEGRAFTENFTTSACTSQPKDAANSNSEVNIEVTSKTSKNSSSSALTSGFGVDNNQTIKNEEQVSQQPTEAENIHDLQKCAWLCEPLQPRHYSMHISP